MKISPSTAFSKDTGLIPFLVKEELKKYPSEDLTPKQLEEIHTAARNYVNDLINKMKNDDEFPYVMYTRKGKEYANMNAEERFLNMEGKPFTVTRGKKRKTGRSNANSNWSPEDNNNESRGSMAKSTRGKRTRGNNNGAAASVTASPKPKRGATKRTRGNNNGAAASVTASPKPKRGATKRVTRKNRNLTRIPNAENDELEHEETEQMKELTEALSKLKIKNQ